MLYQYKQILKPEEVNFVIYHYPCSDGLISAFSAWKYFNNNNNNITYYPAAYHKNPPNVKGKNVLICDFSYDYYVLLDMIKNANKLLIIDHHKTAEEKLNIERFGQEYADYMKRVPRYFLIKG